MLLPGELVLFECDRPLQNFFRIGEEWPDLLRRGSNLDRLLNFHINPPKIEKSILEQLTDLLKLFGIDGLSFRDYVFEEIIAILPQGKDHSKIIMHQTDSDKECLFFKYGCDAVVRIFEEEFENKQRKNF